MRVEFPGNIQGRNIRETGAKGCLLVTVDPSERAQPDFQPLDVFRWVEVAVGAQAAVSTADAVELTVQAIDDARQEADHRPLAVRVRLACAAGVYRQVTEDMERFRFELAAQAGNQVWVEKIKPEHVGETREEVPAITGDALSELRGTLADLRSDPEATKAIFAGGDCGKLRKVLPPDLRNVFDEQNHDDFFDLATVLLSAGTGEVDQ